MEARERGDTGDETNEYMRQARFIPLVLRTDYEHVAWEDQYDRSIESITAISICGKRCIPIIYRLSVAGRTAQFASYVHQYRAWKWMLGHSDSDDFEYSQLGKLLVPSEICRYLDTQIRLGQWDRYTHQAIKRKQWHR